jgi:hypothetical protein
VPSFGVLLAGRGAHSRHQGLWRILPSPWWEPLRIIHESFTSAKCRFSPNPHLHRASVTGSRRPPDSNILNGFEPNGKRPTCDSYEARLMELLDSSTRKGSNECIAVTPRALDHGLN